MPDDEDFVHDQLMTDEELMANWRQVSAVLQRRALRARRVHEQDPTNAKKSMEFLRRSKEYYAFTRLVYLFGKMVEATQVEMLAAGLLQRDVAKKGEPN